MGNELPMAYSQFGDPEERLSYLVDMIRQLRAMSAADYPSVSKHLQAAWEEADRLDRLRARR